MILVICYVCCTFVWEGLTFSITPKTKGGFVEAPKWIANTLLFKLLLKDGSIKVADQHIDKKEGENDPMNGMTAEGKTEEASENRSKEVDQIADNKPEQEPEVKPEQEPEAKPEQEPEKPRRRKPKKDADAK